MEISLKLNDQKINGLAQLLMVAAKHPDVNDEGMKLALVIIDELKAAVEAAKKETE